MKVYKVKDDVLSYKKDSKPYVLKGDFCYPISVRANILIMGKLKVDKESKQRKYIKTDISFSTTLSNLTFFEEWQESE